MEVVEFRTAPDGNVYFKAEGQAEARLTRFTVDIIGPLLSLVRSRFPECYSTLFTIYDNNRGNKEAWNVHAFKMASRFIRCNFGEHDLLTQDIENNILHFEEVKCPLRGGFCPHEKVICKPKGLIKISTEEKKVVRLYLEGFTFDEIAEQLVKSPATVKTQLMRIKMKLGVKNCRDIIKVFRSNNYLI